MNPYFSIVMPVKNGENVIAEAIDTIIEQFYENWELIVVNDHSADKTADIVREYKDARIKLFDLPEAETGISSGRDFGNKKAKADIIVVADADDWNYANRLQDTIDYFYAHPDTDVFYGNIDLYYEDTKELKTRWFQNFDAELLKHINFIPNVGTAYKKDAYFSVSGYDKSLDMSEDYDLWLQFLEAGKKFGCVNKSFVKVRMHASSIRGKNPNTLREVINIVRKKHELEVSEDQIKKLANKEVYEYFTSDKKRKTWIE